MSSCSDVDRLHREYTAARQRLVGAVAELDRNQTWRTDGSANLAAWLSARFQESYAETLRWVQDARALGERPALAAAYTAGDVSTTQMRAVAALSEPGADDAVLLEAVAAGEWDVGALLREVARERVLRREHTDDGVYLSIEPARDERFMDLRGRLSFDDGATLMQQVDKAVPPGTAWRSIDRWRAEGLARLARRDAAGDTGRATLVVHVDGSSAPGRLDNGAFISRAAVERLACDARVQPVVERDGAAIGVGRTARVVPPWLARLVRSRDEACVFPGCGRTAFAEVHHVRHWLRDGGATDLGNLVLTCSYHHKLVHEHGWRLEGPAGRDITWVRPDGSRFRRGRALVDTS